MNENNKSNTLLLTVIAVATLLVAVIGATFAYFTANTSGTETASTVNINAATLTIVFADGGSSVTVADTAIEPSTTALLTKNFTVTGTNNTSAGNPSDGMYMPYRLNLVVTQNTFVLANQETGTSISFRMTHDNSSAAGFVPDTPANTYVKVGSTVASKEVAGSLVGRATAQTYNATLSIGTIPVDNSAENVNGVYIGRGYFAPTASGSQVHKYSLTVYFMEDGTNQDADKSSTFTAYIDCSTADEALSATSNPTRNSALDFTKSV